MKIHWGRIVVGAIALELALIIVFVPLLSRVDMSILAPIIGVVFRLCIRVGMVGGS